MSYFRRPNPRSNWKRPKPKIYDCNTRDLEKFYQDSYNDYLSVKNDYRSRQLERETRGDPEQLTRRFEQRRASSLVYGEDDSPRTFHFLPNRQISNEGNSEQSSTSRTRSERTEFSSELPRDARSTTSSSKTVTFTNSLNANDSESQMAGIETRLERLRRLREELGLPAENNGGASQSSATSSYESSSNRTQSSLADSRNKDRWSSQEPSGQVNGGESSYSSKFRSSLRNGQDKDDTSSYTSTSRTSRFSAPSADDDTTTVTRTSRFKSSTTDDDSSSYTPKTTRFKLPESNGNESSYESSSTTSRRNRVEKPSLEGIDMNFDDDALLTDMRKKLPTSSEILDRIKNMDIE